MGLFKFQNYSAIKNAQDNPRILATADTYNGYVFKVVDGAGGIESATPCVDADDAKVADLHIMLNVVDKPELLNYADYKVETGEYIRGFRLKNLIGEKVEFTSDLVTDTYSTVNVGDYLIPRSLADTTNTMKWKKSTVTGHGICLKVTAKNTFGVFTIDGSGGGYECKIVSN